MKSGQRIAAVILLALIAGTVYGLFRVRKPAIPFSNTGKAQQEGPQQSSPVDESPIETAGQLAQLADSLEEQAAAKDALRLSDHEVDLAFDIALRNAAAHPPALSPEAKEIQARLQKAQRLQQVLQAQVAQLTAEAAKAGEGKKEAPEDALNLTNADLDLADNEVEDATQDLMRAGGNRHDRLQQMKQDHEDATRATDNGVKLFPPVAPEQFGLLHRYEQWSALHRKQLQLWKAKSAAESAAASLLKRHEDLEAQIDAEKASSQDLVLQARRQSTGPGQDQSKLIEAAQAARQSRSHEESAAVLAKTKQIASDQLNLSSFDKRIDLEEQLAATYAGWINVVQERQRRVVGRALRGALIVLIIALIGLFFDRWLEKLLGRTALDRRQVETLRTVTRVSLQVAGVIFILLVIFGPPGQLGTFLGLAGAGLTIALKDFIVAFIGWLVLMGKNGIRLGDWVEINGVTGEVVQLGMLHTVLLETGNWTDSGHPTGRRVTFTNSFAIEGHYFNFSTSGQWLWDELQVVLPTGRDPYPIVDAIHKKVLEATTETARQAEQEWQRAARSRDMKALSAAPAINVKPVIGGVEVRVRYVTRASERYQLRAKLYQAAVDLLGPRAATSLEAAPPQTADC